MSDGDQYASLTDDGSPAEAAANAFAVNREHDDGSDKNNKIVMLVSSVLGQALAIWICVGGGATVVGGWFGCTWAVQYPLRARLMAVCVGMLCIKDVHRCLFLLKRKMDLGEALGVAEMMAVVYCAYALLATGLDKADAWGGCELPAERRPPASEMLLLLLLWTFVLLHYCCTAYCTR